MEKIELTFIETEWKMCKHIKAVLNEVDGVDVILSHIYC